MSLIGSIPLTLVSFVFLISIVVVFHELGHYWAGRLCGVHAEAFSMGFGPTIASWRDKRGTVWRIAAFPLGGYVKFLGDAGAASEPDAEKLDEMRRRMGPDADKCYHFKPVWQRAFVTVAGPLANFVLAIVIFSSLVLFVGGPSYDPPIIGSVAVGSAAEEAGLQPGDRIVSIDGVPIDSFQEIPQQVVWRPDEIVTVEVERNGQRLSIDLAARATRVQDEFGGWRTVGQIGVGVFMRPTVGRVQAGSRAEAAGFRSGDRILSINDEPVASFGDVDRIVDAHAGEALTFRIQRDAREMTLQATPEAGAIDADAAGPFFTPTDARLGMRSIGRLVVRDEYNPVTAVGFGLQQTWTTVSITVRYVSRVVTGRASPEQLNGPIGIVTMAGQTASRSLEGASNTAMGVLSAITNLIYVAGFLSVGLGLVNLLPIPILDGGHLVYYAYEAVARRPLSMKAQAIGFRVGLALVLGMMLVATWNDINYKLSQIF